MIHSKYVVELFFFHRPEDDSVSYLYLTVGLRMFDRGDQVLDAQPCQEVFVSLSFELSVDVGDNGLWETVPLDEVFPGELFHLTRHNFSQWSCFYLLGEVVDGDQQVFDYSWGLWQWSQDVHSSHGERPKGAQTVKIVRRSVWHVCKLLASFHLLVKLRVSSLSVGHQQLAHTTLVAREHSLVWC